MSELTEWPVTSTRWEGLILSRGLSDTRAGAPASPSPRKEMGIFSNGFLGERKSEDHPRGQTSWFHGHVRESR